jgi:hypothetical protein
MKKNKISLVLQAFLKNKNIAQKDMTDVFNVKAQGGVSKRFVTGYVTIDELFLLSEKYGIDLFSELSKQLPNSIKARNSDKEYISPIEEAIISLVKKIK